MSPKVAMIGAGRVVFCKTLVSDMMATPALAGAEYALMNRTESKPRRMETFADASGVQPTRIGNLASPCAVLTLKGRHEMVSAMLEPEWPWRPPFEGTTVRPTPTIDIPPDPKPVDVPLDPALAINKRFGTRLEQDTGDEDAAS